jgi:hypothetical protein
MAVKFNIGTLAGGAGSPLPAAVARQSLLIHDAGTHGVTRPICPHVARNCHGLKLFHPFWVERDTHTFLLQRVRISDFGFFLWLCPQRLPRMGRNSGGPVTSTSPFTLRTSILVRARKTWRHNDKMRQIATKHDIHRLGACLKNPGGAAAKDIGRGPGGEVGAGAPPEGVQRAVPTGPMPAMTKRLAAQRVYPPQNVSRGLVAVGKCASVVECGGPPPLFWRQTTVPMLTETAIYS